MLPCGIIALMHTGGSVTLNDSFFVTEPERTAGLLLSDANIVTRAECRSSTSRMQDVLDWTSNERIPARCIMTCVHKPRFVPFLEHHEINCCGNIVGLFI